jgi:hypothetical protein
MDEHTKTITHAYGCKLQLELLRMGAITPEPCRAKHREESRIHKKYI